MKYGKPRRNITQKQLFIIKELEKQLFNLILPKESNYHLTQYNADRIIKIYLKALQKQQKKRAFG